MRSGCCRGRGGSWFAASISGVWGRAKVGRRMLGYVCRCVDAAQHGKIIVHRLVTLFVSIVFPGGRLAGMFFCLVKCRVGIWGSRILITWRCRGLNPVALHATDYQPMSATGPHTAASVAQQPPLSGLCAGTAPQAAADVPGGSVMLAVLSRWPPGR